MKRLNEMTAQERKQHPVYRGVLAYFPDACAAVAHVSFVGNEQHNPGQPMHWARGKSSDHADCIVRHLIERGSVDTDGLSHSAKLAWRALANLQIEIEDMNEQQALIDAQLAHAPRSHAVGSDARTATEYLAVSRAPANNAYLSTAKGLYYIDAADGEVVALPTHIANDSVTRIVYCHSSERPDGVVIGRLDKNGMQRFDDGPHHNLVMGLDPGAVGGDSTVYHGQVRTRKPRCYIAGPMRGYPKFNFPAFDKARDLAISKGWDPISPADIDREEGIDENTEQGSTDGPAASRVFAERDCRAILSLRAEDGDALALLPGWTKSTGARAEFFLASWVGLAIIDARTMRPFNPAARYGLKTSTTAGVRELGEAAMRTLDGGS